MENKKCSWIHVFWAWRTPWEGLGLRGEGAPLMHAFFFMVNRMRKLWVLIICECMYKKMMDYFRNVVACYLFENECILDVVECMVGCVWQPKGEDVVFHVVWIKEVLFYVDETLVGTHMEQEEKYIYINAICCLQKWCFVLCCWNLG